MIEALLDPGASDLEAISNNCGTGDWGLGRFDDGQAIAADGVVVRGRDKEFARQFLPGELEGS